MLTSGTLIPSAGMNENNSIRQIQGFLLLPLLKIGRDTQAIQALYLNE